METTPDRVARKDDELVSRRIAGETIIVPIRGKVADLQHIYILNPVAEYIWERLDGRTSLNELLQGILETFDVGPDQAEGELQAFVSELVEAGLATGVT